MPAPPPKSPPRAGPPATSQGPPAPGSPTQQADLTGKKTDQLADEAAQLEEELEELKVKYEMYFLGTERREPHRWRDDLKKKIQRLRSAFTRNTGLRFRIQSLHARYISYERLWQRSVREKEEGTYRRDLFKARLRSQEAPSPPAADAATASPGKADAPAARADLEAAIAAAAAKDVRAPGAAPPAGRPGKQARPAGGGPGAPAVADAQMRALYDAYVTAKRRCNEDVSRLTYEAVAKSVSKQIPELMARFHARSVDFKVVIKDGKAILKAIPKI